MGATIVQSRHKYPGNSDTFASNITSGNHIIVLVAGSGTGTDLTSCTDNLGNTYTPVHAILVAHTTGGRTQVRCWIAPVTSAGSCTVTVSNISDVGIVRMIEVSGLEGTIEDVDAVSSTSDPTNFSLTTANEASFFFLWANENGDRFTSFDGGITLFGEDTGHSDASGYALDIAAGSPSYSVNLTASGDPASACVAFAVRNTSSGSPTNVVQAAMVV